MIGRVDRIEGTDDVLVSVKQADTTHKYRMSWRKFVGLMDGYNDGKTIALTANPAQVGLRPARLG